MEIQQEQKVGVFLFRGQPVHKSHMWIIKKTLDENDSVCLVLGSSNRAFEERNPFPIEVRLEMLNKALKELENTLGEPVLSKVKVLELPDWSSEDDLDSNKVWGHYLYYNVVRVIGQRKFKLYYSDEPSIIENWFDDEVKSSVELVLIPRESILDGLSATRIRDAILSDTSSADAYLQKYLPESVYKMVPDLRDILKEIRTC